MADFRDLDVGPSVPFVRRPGRRVRQDEGRETVPQPFFRPFGARGPLLTHGLRRFAAFLWTRLLNSLI